MRAVDKPPRNIARRGGQTAPTVHKIEERKKGLIRHEPLLLQRLASGTDIVPDKIYPELIEVRLGIPSWSARRFPEFRKTAESLCLGWCALPNERVRGVLVACAFEVGDCASRRALFTEDFKFRRVFYVIELGLTTSSCKEGGNSEFGPSDNFGPCMRPLPLSLSGSLYAFWIRGLLKIGRTM